MPMGLIVRAVLCLGLFLSVPAAYADDSDGLEGFGNFARKKPKHTPTPVSTPIASPGLLPSPTPKPTKTPKPTPVPLPSPSPIPSQSGQGGGGGGMGQQFLGGVLGGLIGGLAGGGGLGGGLGGLFGGGGGSNPGGQFPGISNPQKYGQQIDFGQQFVEQATKDQMQEAATREEQCEEEQGEQSAQSTNPDANQVGGLGDQMMGIYGPEFNDGPVKSMAQSSGMIYNSPSLGYGSNAVLSEMTATAAGERINPYTGQPQNLIVVFECHGGGDYLQSDARGGITGAQMAGAINRGHAMAQQSGKTPGNVTVVDGGCMSGRCRTMQQQTSGAGQNVHGITGAGPNNYAWHSGGQAHIATHLATIVKQQAALNPGVPVTITPQMLGQAVQAVGNNAYGFRKSPWKLMGK